MTQEQTSAGRDNPLLMPREFAEMGRKAIETMMGMQMGLLESFQTLNQQWMSHAEAEAKLASQFLEKLAAAKSLPDAASACQECMNRRMELLAEDGRQLMAASGKVMPQLLNNGFSSGST